MTLYLTTLARNQLAAADGPALAALTLTRLQAGSGSGPGGAMDAGRVALRTPRDAAAVVELDAPDGVLAVAAEITGTDVYDVDEVGLFGRVGAGAELLVAYWSAGGAAIGGLAIGSILELTATLGIQDDTAAPVVLSQIVPGPPGLPGDCSQTEADLVDCQAARTAAETARDACQADLMTRTVNLDTCEGARDGALADLAACRTALLGEHLVTEAGTTRFAWPWGAATRALVLAYGGGGGGGSISYSHDGRPGAETTVSRGPAVVRARGGPAGEGGVRPGGPGKRPTPNGGRGMTQVAGVDGAGSNANGGYGASGEIVRGEIHGLSLGDVITITVGGGGAASSAGASQVRPPEVTALPGRPGWALIVPRE